MQNISEIELNIDAKKFKKKLNIENGKDGKDYVLTSKDKKEIASGIKVPVVEKIIEKTETIIEKPIYTNELNEDTLAEVKKIVEEKISNVNWEDIKDRPDILQLILNHVSAKTYSLEELDNVNLSGLSKDSNGNWILQDSIPQVNSDWNATSGVAEILNKPNIADYAKLAVSITHADFRTLYNTSTLVPNQWYLITDYQTVDYIRQSNIPVYQWHTGAVEQIYVLALDVNEVCPEGWSKDFPDEKILYKPSRTIFSENPDWSLDNTKTNYGTIEIDTPSATIVQFTNNPFSVAPKDGTNFIMNITDNNSFNYDYDASNYLTDWQFDVNGDFELLTTYYAVPVYRYIEYYTSTGNSGSQEIFLPSEYIITPTTPLTSFATIDPGNYYYFYVVDNDTGAENYFDYIGKDEVWEINALGQFVILDPGTYTSNYAYYEEGVGNSGDIDITIQGSNEFSLDRLDWNLRKGSDQTGNTWFSINWSDSSTTDLSIPDYGVTWEISGNSVFLLDDPHDLTTDLVYIEGGPMGTDQNTQMDLGDDVYVYSDFYTLGLTVDLTGYYSLNGGYSYEVAGSDSGLIIGRQIPDIDLEVDVDYRATKFRRYQITAPTYSSATTYSIGSIVLFNNETYVCLTDSLNKTPSSQPLYWIKMTTNENNSVINKYLGKDSIGRSVINPYNSGVVTSVQILNGGAGYSPSTTITLRVLAGDGQCTFTANTNSGGGISSVGAIVTSGRGYPPHNSSFPYYCSVNGSGSGVTVVVGTQTYNDYYTITPDLSSYTDFDILPDISQIRGNAGLKIKNLTTNSLDTPLDIVIKENNNIGANLYYRGGVSTLGYVAGTKATLSGNVVVTTDFSKNNIDLVSEIISVSIISSNFKLLQNSSLYYIENSNIDSIKNTLTGSYRIINTSGVSWEYVIMQHSDSNTLNYLLYWMTTSQILTRNYFNKAEYFVQSIGYRMSENNVTGYLKRVWCNSFFNSNIITGNCWYITVRGSYFENNTINGVVGVETSGGNSFYPCFFETFSNNVIYFQLLDVVGYNLVFSGNVVKNVLRQVFTHREGSNYFQFSLNTLNSAFFGFYSFTNNGGFNGNYVSSTVGNIIYNYDTGQNKQFNENTIFGTLRNLTMNKGNVINNVFYNSFGSSTINTINSDVTNAVTLNVFYGAVNGNSFTGLLTGNLFNYTCQNNIFSQQINSSIFEQNFISNTFTGNISRVTFTKQVSSLAIPDLADVTFPTMVIKGKDDGASTQIFLVENASGVDIFRVTGNDKIEVNGITGNSSFNFGKSISYPYREATSNTTLGQNDHVLECTANTFTVTLPSASSCARRVYFVENSGTGIITVDAESSQTINGELTQTVIQWDCLQLMSNGTNWRIL